MTALQTEALTADELVKIARKQIDAFNNGDWEQLRGLLSSDASYHEFGTERAIEGPEQIIDVFKGWKTAFPDAAGTVTSSVASGDTAVLEVTWKGMQYLLGFAPPKRDGKTHDVDVRVTSKGLKPRAKKSYVAPKE